MARFARKSEVLASSVISSTNQALATLVDIWDGLGIKEEMRLQRIEEVKKHIEELFNRMIREEREMKGRIEKSIEFCKKQMKDLCRDLSIEDYKLDENSTVLQIEKDLRVRLEFLTKQKSERLEELKRLQEEDQALCTDLCVTPYYVPSGSIPSLKQMEELKEHIKVQTEEKRKRLEIFSTLRADVRRYYGEIGHQPENTFEQDAICEDEEAFFLTTENIRALTILKEQIRKTMIHIRIKITKLLLKSRRPLYWNTHLYHHQHLVAKRPSFRLQQRKNYVPSPKLKILYQTLASTWDREQLSNRQLELKKEALLSTVNAVKEKVHPLWDLLQVTPEEREVCQRISGKSLLDEKRMWERELARLEELKMANLKQVILKTREELNAYWDKCFYALEQREDFAPYYSDDFTEDLLFRHDEELMKMKAIYEKRKLILDAVAKWETSWAQFVILERKASDPNRFSNRGGTLLKEEKERARLQKLLSKLEEELKSRMDTWEAEEGCTFLIKGSKFMDYVANQWEMLKQQKERVKQDRTQKKDTVQFKTPIKRPAGQCTQGTPSNKTRKLNGTTNSTVCYTNMVPANGSQTTGKVPLPTIKTPLKTRDTSLRTPLHDNNKQTVAFTSQPGSYTEFKEEMCKKASKDVCFNSTVNENH